MWKPIWGSFREVIRKGAFDDIPKQDVRALMNHESSKLLARWNQGKGTLNLEVDERGLKYSFEVPDTTTGKELRTLIERGDITQSSFQFAGARSEWNMEGEKPLRELRGFAKVLDVSPVTFAAYNETSVALRSMPSKPEPTEIEIEPKKIQIPMENQPTGMSPNEARDLKKFNLLKALQGTFDGKLDGLEGEMAAEGRNEARSQGNPIGERSLALPQALHKAIASEMRNHTVDPNTAGGYNVPTEFAGLIQIYQPDLVVTRAGATVMSDLSGNLDMSVQDNALGANWEGEQTASDEQSTPFSRRSMSPKRAASWAQYSRQLFFQSSPDVQNFIASELGYGMANLIDVTALHGDGVDPKPMGLFSNTDVPTVTGPINTYEKLVEMEKTLANNNALTKGTPVYVSDYNVLADLKTTKLDAGSGRFLVEGLMDPTQTANGYRIESSTNVAANSVAFGIFSELFVGYWGTPVLILDEITGAGTSAIKIYQERFVDTLVRRPEAFVKSQWT